MVVGPLRSPEKYRKTSLGAFATRARELISLLLTFLQAEKAERNEGLTDRACFSSTAMAPPPEGREDTVLVVRITWHPCKPTWMRVNTIKTNFFNQRARWRVLFGGWIIGGDKSACLDLRAQIVELHIPCHLCDCGSDQF